MSLQLPDYIPTELIKTLGSLASIASGYLNVKRAIIDSGRAERTVTGRITGILTEEEKKVILDEPSQIDIVRLDDKEALQIISPEILQSALDRIKRAKERYLQIIAKGEIYHIDEAQAVTRNEICLLLRLVLDHNNGHFPDNSDLLKIWREFRCTQLHPMYSFGSY